MVPQSPQSIHSEGATGCDREAMNQTWHAVRSINRATRDKSHGSWFQTSPTLNSQVQKASWAVKLLVEIPSMGAGEVRGDGP